MGVGKNHALRSELVNVGCWDPACLGREAVDVSIAKIVAEDIDDIGFLAGGCRENGCQEGEAEELWADHFHGAAILRKDHFTRPSFSRCSSNWDFPQG